ncbi:MAG: hypothetical protein ACOC8L_13335 [Spirochaetota bacterium]
MVKRKQSMGLAGLLIVVAVIAGCTTTTGYQTLEELKGSEGLTEAEFDELGEQVAELDSKFNVERRGDHQIYFAYGDELIRRGRYAEALQEYKAGLRVSALEFDAQVRAAELEIELQERDSAYERLRFVVSRSNDDAVSRLAASLIENNRLEADYVLTELPDRPDLIVEIQPIGDAPSLFVTAVAARLEQEFHISTKLKPPIEIGEEITAREHLTHRANRAIEAIEEQNSQEILAEFYASMEIPASGPTTAVDKQRVFRALVLSQENGEEVWRQLLDLNFVQYDANDLLAQMREQQATGQQSDAEGQTTIGVIGIVDQDIYREGLNFLFALTQPGASVMSTNRLFDPEHDSVEQGVHRSVVQAMTSYVQMLGLTRATRMPCATAYPNSLAEFDEKEDRLCEETRVQLAEFYRSR